MGKRVVLVRASLEHCVNRDSRSIVHASSPRSAEPLPEYGGSDGFETCVGRNKPCVLRGAGRDWPAVLRWTMASLADRLGDLEVPGVPLRGAEEGGAASRVYKLGVDMRRGVTRTSCRAGRVLRNIENGQATNYLIVPMGILPEEIQREVPTPIPCQGADWVATNLWVSPAQTVTPLHFDLPHNFLVQVRGRKKAMVFERGHFKAMYPEPPWSSVPNFSRVDPRHPDLDRYPAFQAALPLVTVLDAGDVLFLPSATWHHVTSETDSISVNFWWADGMLAWIARGANAFKRMRGIR